MSGTWSRRLVLGAALLLLTSCAVPFAGQGQSNRITLPSPTPTPSQSPSPSPSPSPTTKIALSAPSFKVGEVNAAYPTSTFVASGGLQPYQWTVASGAIPMGLNLGSDGSLAGTPSTPGTYSFVIQVADSGDQTAKAAGSILVRPALSATLTPACATTCNVEIGCANVCGAFGSVGGGVGPYSYSVISGQPPGGTSMDAHAMKLDGIFNGPTGTDQFTAMVTDGYGQTATLSPYFQMFPHISLTGGTCSYPNPGPGQPAIPPGDMCLAHLPYSGGLPGPVTMTVDKWVGGNCGFTAVVPCPEPPVSGSGNNDTLAVTVGRMPPNSPYPNPTGTFTIHVVDQGICAANSHCASTTVTLVLSYNG